MITFGNEKFKTKKASENFIRNIIYELDECKITSEHTHFNLFCELVSFKFVDCEIIAIELFKTALSRKTLHMRVLLKGNDEYILTSWRDCSRRKHTPISKDLSNAMRHSIYPDCIKYKYESTLIECVYCKSKDDIQVDHLIPFFRLKKDFLNTYDGIIPEVFDWSKITGTCSFKIQDKKFMNLWVLYHTEKAVFQLLCSSCNGSKGKKDLHLQQVSNYDNKDDVKNKKIIKHLQERIIKTELKLDSMKKLLLEITT